MNLRQVFGLVSAKLSETYDMAYLKKDTVHFFQDTISPRHTVGYGNLTTFVQNMNKVVSELNDGFTRAGNTKKIDYITQGSFNMLTLAHTTVKLDRKKRTKRQ